jgi:thiosulfate/3-mercaptopyruvate sulfurtransferase
MPSVLASGPLVSVDELAAAAPDDAIRIVDTRWRLGAPVAGRELFETEHISRAIHLNMDRDLAAPPDSGGRHPLPDAADFAEAMSRAGVDAGTTVVAYDDGDGLGAARLWWLLRHFGHEQVVVLDGGLAAWKAAGQPLESGSGQTPTRRQFEAHVRADDILDTDQIQSELARGAIHLIDARAPERWRGEVEPVDPVPGRIPGSLNAPAAANLGDGRFLSRDELRRHYAGLSILDGKPIVASCGSGVTACVDLLGLEVAGIRGAKLYPGSYSAWLARGLPAEKG